MVIDINDIVCLTLIFISIGCCLYARSKCKENKLLKLQLENSLIIQKEIELECIDYKRFYRTNELKLQSLQNILQDTPENIEIHELKAIPMDELPLPFSNNLVGA